MPRAVLFDLDDTLLGNSMDVFLPAYFKALTRHLRNLVPPQRLLNELMRATDAMNAGHHARLTNEEVFASVFYPAMDPDRATLERAFEGFYAEAFPRLRSLTKRRPEARSLVTSAIEHGLQVVVATNPLFPRTAVEQRLAWAGVSVQDFDYALVTTYENMHATKASASYYSEILEHVSAQPSRALMVGDSWEMDIVPASTIGLPVYWTTEGDEVPSSIASLVGRGTLSDLWALVDAHGWTLGAD
jgi:FMN phosphatase YigB (HAD superfamily)